MVVVDIGSLSFLETACWKTGLLETSWLDKKVETLRQSGGESAKEGC
jgi:AMMECR1 domain-containing protein